MTTHTFLEFQVIDREVERGGVDFAVTLHLDGRLIEGEITLYRDPAAPPGSDQALLGAWGSPLEHWCCARLVGVVRDLEEAGHGPLAAALVRALDHLACGEVTP